jgi:hypothetical protein
MGILARLVEGVNAADIGVLLALVWLVVRLEWTRSDIDGVKQELTGVKQDVKKLLTGDVAWMQAVLRDRQRSE